MCVIVEPLKIKDIRSIKIIFISRTRCARRYEQKGNCHLLDRSFQPKMLRPHPPSYPPRPELIRAVLLKRLRSRPHPPFFPPPPELIRVGLLWTLDNAARLEDPVEREYIYATLRSVYRRRLECLRHEHVIMLQAYNATDGSLDRELEYLDLYIHYHGVLVGFYQVYGWP